MLAYYIGRRDYCFICQKNVLRICKMVSLGSKLGSNLTFFPGSVNLNIFPGSFLIISCKIFTQCRFSLLMIGFKFTGFTWQSNFPGCGFINVLAPIFTLAKQLSTCFCLRLAEATLAELSVCHKIFFFSFINLPSPSFFQQTMAL